MTEQHWNAVIEDDATWAKIAGRATADVWPPRAGNGRPVESPSVFRQKTQAGRIGLQDREYFIGQRLQDGARRC